MKAILLVGVATVAAIAVGLVAKAEHTPDGDRPPAGVSTPAGSSSQDPVAGDPAGSPASPATARATPQPPAAGPGGAGAAPDGGAPSTAGVPPVAGGAGKDDETDD